MAWGLSCLEGNSTCDEQVTVRSRKYPPKFMSVFCGLLSRRPAVTRSSQIKWVVDERFDSLVIHKTHSMEGRWSAT
jgi:hypothetical protein